METLKQMVSERRTGYRPVPFWSWNDRLDPEELKKQIRRMKAQGMGGFFMHARGGLKTEYLSQEWMACIRACCEEAKEQQMDAWIYDENGWPTGFVGGKLLKDPENRDMYIRYETGDFDEKADVNYLLAKDRLVRTSEGETGQEYLRLYLCRSASTVDILNPVVVDRFLTETHEKYRAEFGTMLSQAAKGFFTDEPQYFRWQTPYTTMLESYFQETYGEDILDRLGLLFVEKEGYRDFRYKYWLAMQSLMLENFAKKVYTWCEDHQMELTGHYVEEVSMGCQIMCCGGVMPFYEYEHIPGIDWLARTTDNELSPKQLGSVARQLGKKQALTETFGCCGWDVTPGELRRIAGFQYAGGVSRMCHHLVPYSERGQRKRDYPAHFHPLNPWIEDSFAEFNDYFTNLSCILAESDEPVRVAILHPIRSAYFDYKRGTDPEEADFGIRILDQKLRKLCRELSKRGIAYHFLDETLMEKYGFVQGAQIGCGQCTYDYLILPTIYTMGKKTEHLLRSYVSGGGRVCLTDGKPCYLEGEPYAYSYLFSNCSIDEIESAQPFTVENKETELYYAYREWNGQPLLFIQNASPKNTYTQVICPKGIGKSCRIIDPLTMKEKPAERELVLHENESLLLCFTDDPAVEKKEQAEYELRFENAEPKYDRNYLTIDTPRYSKDGIHFSGAVARQKIFDRLLAERYRGKLYLRYEFEIRKMPESMELFVEKGQTKNGLLNGKELCFRPFADLDPNLCVADISDVIQQGQNVYEIAMDFAQSDATYHALFGEGVTEGLGNCISYDSEIEAVYLAGHFGVYSADGFTDYDRKTVCAHRFYIGSCPDRISEPTTDGLLFFRGRLQLKQEVTLKTADTLLFLPGRYLTARVWVNGKEAGKLLYDRRLDLSPYAKEGKNEIEVEFVIGNRNLMGPFHCAWDEDFVSPGLFGLCNLPNDTDEDTSYRFYRFYAGKE